MPESACAKRGRRQSNQTQSAMCNCRGKSDGIEQRPTADHHHVTAAVQIVGVDHFQHPLQDVNVVLHFLATGDDLHIACQAEPIAVLSR